MAYLIISDILLMKIYLDIILTYDITAIHFAHVIILFSNYRISLTIPKKLDECYFYDNEESLK